MFDDSARILRSDIGPVAWDSASVSRCSHLVPWLNTRNGGTAMVVSGVVTPSFSDAEMLNSLATEPGALDSTIALFADVTTAVPLESRSTLAIARTSPVFASRITALAPLAKTSG